MTGPQVGTCDTDFSTFLLSFGRCTTVNDDLHHYSVVAIQIFSPKPCRSSQAQQPCTLWDCFSQSISILQVLPTKASTQFDFGVISSTPFTSTKTDRLYGNNTTVLLEQRPGTLNCPQQLLAEGRDKMGCKGESCCITAWTPQFGVRSSGHATPAQHCIIPLYFC